MESNNERKKISKIFNDDNDFQEYNEIYDEKKNIIQSIFRANEALNSKGKKALKEEIKDFNEITLIFDYEILSTELDTQEMNKIIRKIYDGIDIEKTKLNVIIQNSYISDECKKNENKKKLILNKLEISDELYSFSGKIIDMFDNIKVKELTLKQFKFNSKSQLEDFTKFIYRSLCEKLILEDFFIELLIKESPYDDEFNDLDIYFNYSNNTIFLDNGYTNIKSLTLKDCPLFVISENIFKKSDNINIDIDIDENSLLNPSIITKFKIKDNKYYICFDLDSFKIKLEKEGNEDDYDYIDYLKYIFNIIISFKSKEQKIKINKDDGIEEIDRENLYRLNFKNFDVTKFEYITDDDITFIDEDKWIFFREEEIQKKKKWEEFEKELNEFDFETLSNVKELIFDNCSNFFIEWIIYFITGKKSNLDINIINKEEIDFKLLKLKKCSKDYVNLDIILNLKINKLILFDTTLIIGKKFQEEYKLDNFKGSIDNLTIKINSLEAYGKEYNLKTCEIYKILIEFITNNKYKNTNITFEFNTLSSIMSYLAYKEYLNNNKFYEFFEVGKKIEKNKEELESEYKEKLKDTNYIKGKPENHLPIYIFFGSKERRDFIYEKCFNLYYIDNKKDNMNLRTNMKKITLKNVVIRKNYENFEHLIKLKNDIENIKSENEIKSKKLEFGSDGFYIDMDYKNFILKNKIMIVELINVTFSNYEDTSLRNLNIETVINFCSISDDEMKSNNLEHYPLFRIDVKTLNSILYKNFLFEDIGLMFRYYIYKIKEKASDEKEKNKAISNYFLFFIKFFNIFKKENNLVIIINNMKELKEVYCTFCVLRVLLDKYNNKNKYIESFFLPKKELFKQAIGNYFLKEKSIEEDNNEVYSTFNYYYSCEEEEKMKENKNIEIIDGTDKRIYNFEINID